MSPIRSPARWPAGPRPSRARSGGWISGNLGWFIGVTAAVALMIAGFSGPRGAGAGVTNGLTAWGLLFVLSLTVLVPGALEPTDQRGAGLQDGQTTVGGPLGTAGGAFTAESALWVSFWSLLAGVVLSGPGGTRRPRPEPLHQPARPAV